MRHLSLQGRVPDTHEYDHDALGYNYTLSNLQAAVGLAQLERLDELLAHRRRLAERYAAAFADAGHLTFCAEVAPARSNFWLMSVLVDGRDRVEIIDALDRAGIDSRPFFMPMPVLAHLARYSTGPVPVATRLHERGVSLPSSADLDDAAQDRVITALLEA
jgi:perosamine synthetase